MIFVARPVDWRANRTASELKEVRRPKAGDPVQGDLWVACRASTLQPEGAQRAMGAHRASLYWIDTGIKSLVRTATSRPVGFVSQKWTSAAPEIGQDRKRCP